VQAATALVRMLQVDAMELSSSPSAAGAGVASLSQRTLRTWALEEIHSRWSSDWIGGCSSLRARNCTCALHAQQRSRTERLGEDLPELPVPSPIEWECDYEIA